MLKRQFRGLWMITCDIPDCLRSFELNGNWDITPSKVNTIAGARHYGWKVGKDNHLCPTHKQPAPLPVPEPTRLTFAGSVDYGGAGDGRELENIF